MTKEVCLIRHLDDFSSLDTADRDSEITDANPERIQPMAEFTADMAGRLNTSRIQIISSPLKRSTKTSEYLMEYLGRHYSNLNISFNIDPRISTLHHGIYKKKNTEERMRVEKEAWRVFLEQARDNQNIYYRHGDARSIQGTEEIQYPYLLNAFDSPGENQLEFTTRMYSFILDLSEKLLNSYSKELVVISSHASPIFRLHEVDSLSKVMDAKAYEIIKPGTLYVHEWREMDKLKNIPEIMKYMDPGSFGILGMDDIIRFTNVLSKELRYLNTLEINSTNFTRVVTRV